MKILDRERWSPVLGKVTRFLCFLGVAAVASWLLWPGDLLDTPIAQLTLGSIGKAAIALFITASAIREAFVGPDSEYDYEDWADIGRGLWFICVVGGLCAWAYFGSSH